jgi:hypothetical protein
MPYSYTCGRVVAALYLIALMVAGSALAKAAPLADDPANARWYQPRGSQEATWIGREGDPVLVLDKPSLLQEDLLLHVRTDAKQMTLDLRPGHRILLRGHPQRPGIEMDGREVEPAKGQWIRVFLLSDQPTLTVTFDGGSYANLTFEQPTRRPTVELAPQAPMADPEAPVVDVGQYAAPHMPPRQVTPSPGGTDAAARTPGRPRVLRLDSPAAEPIKTVNPDPAVRVRSTAPTRFATPSRDIARELDPEPRWRLNLDAGIDYLSAYHYRGFGRENQNLILQPWTETAVTVFESRTPFVVDYVDLLGGLRSSHQWGPSGGESGERWVELQWYGGVEVGVFNRWRLGAAYVNVESINTSFRDVHQFDLWLGFDDRDPNHHWSLQPYVLLSVEYEHQSDGGWLSQANALDPRFDTGTYLELGVRPQFNLFHLHLDDPVTLTVPARVGLSISDYYEDRQGNDRAFGYAQIGLDLGIPLVRIAAEGNRRFLWQLTTGLHVLYLGNSIRDLGHATGTSTDNFQVIGKVGLSVNY